MLKIGITGGIGSGKSTVCRIFEILGVPVYYADLESKMLLESNPQVKDKIVMTFGSSICDPSGAIDRKKLAGIVFNDKAALDKLNAITHPAVALHFENWIRQQTSTYILKEAAILIESGTYKQLDKIIVVDAPIDLKIDRTIKRDRVSKEEVERRIKNQMPDAEKIKHADFVIKNDEQQLLIPQVLELHQKFM
jgi:dephospho-CoA kinase